MGNNNDSGLDQLKEYADKMRSEAQKLMNNNFKKLDGIMKNAGYKAQKKGKVNKKAATMYLADDDSHVKIEYEDKNDNIKFFEGFK